jgi:serine/threonine-protein kinase
VLLADGAALVADTGILGALAESLAGDGGGAATATLCAADYLAPERRAGQAAPGPRDDLFAVGVLVHEMLTGRPPSGNPEPLEDVRSVPPWLTELERRCRAAEPSARWADAGSALASGNWPSGGA